MTETPNPTHRSDLIRRLFAVTVSVGFAAALAGSKWVNEQRLPAPGELDQLLCLVAGLIFIIGSWEGYHKHIDKTDKVIWIFFTDVAIVFAYLLVLLLSAATQLFLWMVAAVFGLYCFWDLLVVAFCRDPGAKRRFGLTALWCIAFLYLSYLAGTVPGEPIWAAYSVTLAGIVYRVQAMRTTRRTLFAIIAAWLPHLISLFAR